MKEFMLGANYWASNAGADMWREWDEEVVRRDLALLSENGVTTLRVFPNWRDFQPVEPAITGAHKLREYILAGDRYPENPYFLDEMMLERFARFCGIAQEYGMKLIVGLITGWMSGRLYIPAALYEKNIYTDPTAIYFQQLFLKGFVERMKDQPSICAWDLGNECNCMDEAVSKEEAMAWTAMVVNAIRACDSSRPIVSGMHSLELEGVWNIQDQGALTDMLTTHPYPFWIEHCQFDCLTDFRTLLHATAQTQYYETIGKKPCLVEEIGSMGPMISSDERAAGFLQVNLWSNWAHGAPGVLWWCANEQSNLSAPPYDWKMFERELGMLTADQRPKPVLRTMKAFTQELKALNLELPRRQTDAVCILSRGQDHWGIAYMSYLLAKQAGLTVDFAYCGQEELPESPVYFLPSAKYEVMNKRPYEVLKQRVRDGATLYISLRDGAFSEFEELTGLRPENSRRADKSGTVCWNGREISYRKPYQLITTPVRARVLLSEEDGNPLFTEASYGKGKVFFLNFPVEEMLLTMEKGFDAPYFRFYAEAASPVLEKRHIRRESPFVGLTLHPGRDADYAVLVNYTDCAREPGIAVDGDFYPTVKALRGNMERIPAYETVVLRLEKRS